MSILCRFIGGRWDGQELRTNANHDGRPYNYIWIKESREGVLWAPSALTGADRYVWDGAESDGKPMVHIYMPYTKRQRELVGS